MDTYVLYFMEKMYDSLRFYMYKKGEPTFQSIPHFLFSIQLLFCELICAFSSNTTEDNHIS